MFPLSFYFPNLVVTNSLTSVVAIKHNFATNFTSKGVFLNATNEHSISRKHMQLDVGCDLGLYFSKKKDPMLFLVVRSTLG